jgi:hypothetical protein
MEDHMKYVKPEVTSTRAAAHVIMGVAKQSINNEVNEPSPSPAYEADE